MPKYDDVKKYIDQNSNCILLSQFDNIDYNTDKIKLQCACGREFEPTFNKFKYRNKRQCNICSINDTKEKLKLSFDDVKTYIEKHKCILLSKEYINVDSILEIQCTCGEKFQTTFYRFKDGKNKCINCTNEIKNKKLAKTIDKFKEEVFDLVNDEYCVIGDYKNAKVHIEMKHNTCNTTYPVTPTNFLSGYRCPYCHQSKSEVLTNTYLKINKYDFIREYSFDDLTGIGHKLLRFDFAIFNSDKSLNTLIELDGEFHYKKIFKNDNHEILIEHDKRKNTYCKNNNIKLLRIPYWEFKNIEKIIDNMLIPR